PSSTRAPGPPATSWRSPPGSTRSRSALARSSASPDSLRRVHRGERHRHERIPDRAHPHGAGDVLALLSRKQEAPGSAAEGENPRLALAGGAGPEEESCP